MIATKPWAHVRRLLPEQLRLFSKWAQTQHALSPTRMGLIIDRIGGTQTQMKPACHNKHVEGTTRIEQGLYINIHIYAHKCTIAAALKVWQKTTLWALLVIEQSARAGHLGMDISC